MDNIPLDSFKIQTGTKNYSNYQQPNTVASQHVFTYDEEYKIPEHCLVSNNIETKENKENIENIENKEVTEPLNRQPIINKKKYNISELFWCFDFNDPEDKKCCIISHNADFGNLRIALYNNLDNAILKNVIYCNSMNLLVAGTIYPGSAVQFLYYIKNNIKITFTCIEQLINNNGEQWEKERPIVYFELQENIIMNIIDTKNDNQYKFIFKEYNKDMLIKSLKFCTATGLFLKEFNHIK